LDHDLGPEAEVGTGCDVLKWIEERVTLDQTYQPPVIHIHTSNIGARDRMESAVQGIATSLPDERKDDGPCPARAWARATHHFMPGVS
jgi:hypothetical protein